MHPPYEIFWYFWVNSSCIGKIHSGRATIRHLDLGQGDSHKFSPGDHVIGEKCVYLPEKNPGHIRD